jgi:hypothetical protein
LSCSSLFDILHLSLDIRHQLLCSISRWVLLVEQKLLTLLEYPGSPPGLCCRSLFNLLSYIFFGPPLYCLSLFTWYIKQYRWYAVTRWSPFCHIDLFENIISRASPLHSALFHYKLSARYIVKYLDCLHQGGNQKT